jgi:Ubiquitin-conjugating enzyme
VCHPSFILSTYFMPFSFNTTFHLLHSIPLFYSIPPLSFIRSFFFPSFYSISFLQFVISGPDDTPYSNGLFLFDAFFPANYPDTAPKVQNLDPRSLSKKSIRLFFLYFSGIRWLELEVQGPLRILITIAEHSLL